ncbi:hypothetical protein [Arthrobacter globiformis]|uniref:hypothetical protein n=1 Tax=Arthrobacter globiformis TaxID=1665 RepID=UPI00278639CD|nr:hypothetical protein [Arthrobacter globiformis]MDQ0867274.1 hypothetical protein [Arthrobacter globiformis]
MTVKDQWDRLDPGTKKWLLDNPGCLILPHSITAVIREKSGHDIKCDQHGQMMLSPQDRDFIRSKASGAATTAPGHLPGVLQTPTTGLSST